MKEMEIKFDELSLAVLIIAVTIGLIHFSKKGYLAWRKSRREKDVNDVEQLIRQGRNGG
jgi:3-oxoacyl-ACP reductase-like protein